MSFQTLISTSTLAQHLQERNWRVIDCRFSLQDTDQGRKNYNLGHIPGAVYAHLDRDLSAPMVAGETGRHPLPDVESFARRVAAWGIDAQTQVVVYDDGGGGIAGRLWWMLRWLGHDAVALLDGGWAAWTREGRPTRAGLESWRVRDFTPQVRAHLVADVDQVAAMVGDPASRLLDARSAERFRGEGETLDPVGGHIPGAINAPYVANLDPQQHFLSTPALQERFTQLLAGHTTEETVMYCGSGVTACHNILAMVHSGLGEPRLYPGSWSEWVTDQDRPVATTSEG